MARSRPTQQVLEQARARLGRTVRDEWRLDALVGVGGMAAIYAATARDGSRVAIKMLHRMLTSEDGIADRMVREGALANTVQHPAVVHVHGHDVDEVDGAVFLVMDLLEGEPLSATLERAGTLPLEQVLRVMDTVLEALAVAHSHGIVHRDIKPENIFLTSDGAVRVLDFGVARVDDPGFSQTKTGQTHGTPEFMAPEQARGQRDQIDARTDVYACGATMYALLTGKTPHDAETAPLLMMRVASEPAPHLEMARPDLPEPVVDVVDRALEFEPQNRFPDAGAMLLEVRRAREALQRADARAEPAADSPAAAAQPAPAPAPAPASAVAVAPDARPVPAAAPARGRGLLWGAFVAAVALALLWLARR